MQDSLISFICVYRYAHMCWYIRDFIKVYFLVKYNMYWAKYTNHKWATQWIFTANILILIPRRSKKKLLHFRRFSCPPTSHTSSRVSFLLMSTNAFFFCLFLIYMESYTIHSFVLAFFCCSILTFLRFIHVGSYNSISFILTVVFYYLYIPLFWYLGCS